jgi:hypothetical protein
VLSDMTWTVEAAARVAVTLTPPAGASMILPQGQMMLSIPATIAGLPNPAFESPVAATGDGRVVANLTVPRSALGKDGRLTLEPVPPADLTIPTYRWAVTASASITLPLPSDDVLVDGQLLNSIGAALPTSASFVARVFQNGSQVGNAPAVQSNGRFEVRIPSVVTADPVTLFLAPSSPSSTDPWFLSSPFTAAPGENLGTIELPAYVTTGTFFQVATVDQGSPVDGITIAAQTSLGNPVISSGLGGTAAFAGSTVTQDGGIAQLSLVPGTAKPLDYLVLATPPVGSPYAIQCVGPQATPGGPDPKHAVTLATIRLDRRPVLKGTVLDADGDPVPDLTVTATGTPNPPSSKLACSPAPVSAGTLTDAQGAFALPLDPGTYRLDYDPPQGLMVPRWTTASLTITPDLPAQPAVILPRATWLTGTVRDASGATVASAGVRFFSVCTDPTSCPGALGPTLVAATFTDAAGNFQVPVPAPPSP